MIITGLHITDECIFCNKKLVESILSPHIGFTQFICPDRESHKPNSYWYWFNFTNNFKNCYIEIDYLNSLYKISLTPTLEHQCYIFKNGFEIEKLKEIELIDITKQSLIKFINRVLVLK